MKIKRILILSTSAILVVSASVFCWKTKHVTSELLAMNIEAFSNGESSEHKGPFKYEDWQNCTIKSGVYMEYNSTSSKVSSDSTKVKAGTSREQSNLSVRETQNEQGQKCYCKHGGWKIICKEKDCR